MADPILPTSCDFHGKCRDLLHAANLRHGTDGFTSPPKEGVLRIFSPVSKVLCISSLHYCLNCIIETIQVTASSLQPGLNPRTLVTEASMLTTRPLKPLTTVLLPLSPAARRKMHELVNYSTI